MALLYDMDLTSTLLGETVYSYFRVYDDHVEICKVDAMRGSASTRINPNSNPAVIAGKLLLGIKKDLSNTEYMEFVIPIDQIRSVYYKPVNSILATGLLQVLAQGEEERPANMLNATFLPNVINFNRKYNSMASQIKVYLDSRIRQYS